MMDNLTKSISRATIIVGIALFVALFVGIISSGVKKVSGGVVGPKDSLTFEEIDWLEHNNTMSGYEYNLSNFKEDFYTLDYNYQKEDKEIYSPVYDIDRESIEVRDSSIQDGMIYTMCNGKLSDGTIVEILYINEPNTLEFVAMSVMYDDLNGLFTFRDKNGKTVYDKIR